MKTKFVPLGAAAVATALAAAVPAAASTPDPNPRAQRNFPLVGLPPGYRIEKVVGGLTYPTSLAWDGRGRLHVLEAGGQFLDEPPPARLLRISRGRAREVVRLTGRGGGRSGAAAAACADPCGSADRRTAPRSLAPLDPGAVMENPFSKSGDTDVHAPPQHIRELNERIIETSLRAGLSSLGLYEKTLKSIADMQQAVGEASQLEWFSAVAAAQANFTREMAEAYTSAARDFLK
jgi:hypothetical protein